jgi:hypothetical protein
MTVVIGPLHSLDARGTYDGKTYSVAASGTHYYREYNEPPRPPLDPWFDQTYALTTSLALWATMTPAEKSTWSTLAKKWKTSNYHAFLKYNMNAYLNHIYQTKTAP